MSISTTKPTHPLGIPGLCRSVLSFVSLEDEDRCKGVNRMWKASAETLQRGRILATLTPAQIEAFGRKRLSAARIQNARDTGLLPNLKSTFVIGFLRETRDYGERVFAAVRVKYIAEGRCCFRRFLSPTACEGARVTILHQSRRQGARRGEGGWELGVPWDEPIIGYKNFVAGAVKIETMDRREDSDGMQTLIDLLDGKAQVMESDSQFYAAHQAIVWEKLQHPPVSIREDWMREVRITCWARCLARIRRCFLNTFTTSGQQLKIKLD